jgi:hypothetical protein
VKNYSGGIAPTVHKESSKGSVRQADGLPGLSWQIRPLRHTRPARPDGREASGSHKYTEGSGRKTGSILAPPTDQGPEGRRADDGVEPGHTPRPRVGREVRMLLSFQRPSHLFGRGFLSSRRTQEQTSRSVADGGV